MIFTCLWSENHGTWSHGLVYVLSLGDGYQHPPVWTKLWSPLFKSRLARTKGKFVCLWTSLMCNIWDSIINVSFGCQNPLEALMKLYGYPPIHASSDDNAVDLIFIHYICLLLVSFRSVFICSVLYFVALYQSHVPYPITYGMSVYFFCKKYFLK
jgi:hypothetical protein